jgi:tetratricopeptide (TPR) repeat protein
LGLRDGRLPIVALAWLGLAQVTGYDRVHPDEGARWLDLAEAIIASLPGREDLELQRLLGACKLAGAAEHFDEMAIHARRAVALAERIAPGDSQLAAALDLLSGALVTNPETLEESAKMGERAISVLVQAGLGDTVSAAAKMNNLALTYEDLDRYEDTIALGRRALAIDERNLPPGHARIVSERLMLGSAYVWLHRWAEAEAELQKIAPIIERYREELPHQVPEVWMHLGQANEGLGRGKEALAFYQRALVDKDLYQTNDRGVVELGIARLIAKSSPGRARALARAARAHVQADKVPNSSLLREIDAFLQGS